MAIVMSNNAASTLASGISSGATSFTVASGSTFPALSSGDFTFVTIGTEVIKVTARSGANFTCDQTTASHSSGDTVELRVTSELLNAFSTDAESLAKAGGEMSGNITMAGSQTVDGRDLSTDGSKLDGIAASANNYVHPNHSGDVTSSADGAQTIAADAVTYAKMQNVSATDRILGRDSSGAGIVEEITPANLRTMINVADNANAYVHPNHSGDVTSSADGAQTIAADAVTYAKMQNVTATDRILGRDSSGAGIVEEITPANLRTMINVEDGATADQTAAQIKTALENGIDSVHYVDGSIDTDHIGDDQVTAAKLANSINTDIATGVTANTTANAAMPKAGGAFTGNITTNGLIDTRDVAADGVLATNALPKAGGTITGTVTVGANAVGTMTTDNDGSFAMSASNNFKCTPAGNFALTFTAIVAQSGNILFINSGGHTISAHANTKVDANLLATISTAGTYLLAYFSDGTNVYMTNSAAYA
jgi:hypothetical protein